jgi:acetylglutamate kinase
MMNPTNIEQARILSEALPYIQKFHGKTMVVKYGGGAMLAGDKNGQAQLSDELRRAVISDIVLLSLVGIKVVVVHGGGPEINALLDKMGKQPRFVNGLRYTDDDTMEVVQMVLCGRVGKQLAQLIGELGGKSLSLSGQDGRMFTTAKMSGEDLGWVGEVTAVDPSPVQLALDGGYIPVVSTVACGEADEPGAAYNINADIAAAQLAIALGAEKLILLTDVRGLLRDINDETSLISAVNIAEVDGLTAQGIIGGGMIPKVNCCVDAVRGGVAKAHILDGRIPHSMLIEILSDKGIGTVIQGG